MLEILLAIVLGPLLWLAGAVLFDVVHWLLHAMLRSRLGLLRALARPHGVHHEWIDRELVAHEDRRLANVWCHIVPEYLTQLVFTGLVAWLLPTPFAVVLVLLQTALFLYILRDGGRDVNHRPAARIDAHPPGWGTPPSYHALHHAWPDAHFSSYTKLVDRIVGGGAQLAERRFAWRGPATPLTRALRGAVEAAGGHSLPAAAALTQIDVLVLGDPEADLVAPVEDFIAALRDRQLPPEVWALRAGDADATARHYRDDPRVCFRTLLVPTAGDGEPTPEVCRRAARRALAWIRRDAHCAPLGRSDGLRAVRRFQTTRAQAPPGVPRRGRRLEAASPAGGIA